MQKSLAQKYSTEIKSSEKTESLRQHVDNPMVQF